VWYLVVASSSHDQNNTYITVVILTAVKSTASQLTHQFFYNFIIYFALGEGEIFPVPCGWLAGWLAGFID
jgi:hypothetical protein